MTCRPREQGSAGAGAGRRDDRASGHEKVMTREHMRLRLIDAVVLRRDDVGMIPEGLGSDHLSICPPGLWVHSSGWAGARHLFVGGTPGMTGAAGAGRYLDHDPCRRRAGRRVITLLGRFAWPVAGSAIPARGWAGSSGRVSRRRSAAPCFWRRCRRSGSGIPATPWRRRHLGAVRCRSRSGVRRAPL